ncbi:MAG TPA: beta galactosidase jelly roll domain-containing protein, partial [Bacteroidota bacterium]|nr:beta galactosidase jelly roll domain-containing protein [Bacteroidota bacterium]
MRKRISLNGTWQLQPTGDESMPTAWSHSIPVPALVDVSNPGYDWRNIGFHWYRCTFNVEAGNTLAFLVIEQAMFGTEVWLNGKYLGGDIACYTSQEYDIRAAMNVGKTNELIIRVGQRANLPSHSAVGNDQERTTWIPGIWGDVYLELTGNPRIKLVQTIPDISAGSVRVKLWIENRSDGDAAVQGRIGARERRSGESAGESISFDAEVPAHAIRTVETELHLSSPKLWSLENPFLYDLESCILNHGLVTDLLHTTFGMREFKIVGPDFYFNNQRIVLRGGNIAFHRFLSDPDRKLLPWNADWIRNVLIDIPKAH